MSEFAKRLKIAMQYRGCSGRKLCEMIGAHRSTVSQYLNSICEPKQDRLIAIAKSLNVSPEWLAGQEVSMLNSPKYERIVSILKNLTEEELDRVLQMLRVMLGGRID
jgi:transcriptional regulator with XRE-family HTH domain